MENFGVDNIFADVHVYVLYMTGIMDLFLERIHILYLGSIGI